MKIQHGEGILLLLLMLCHKKRALVFTDPSLVMDVTVYGKTALDMMYIEKDMDIHEFIKFREGLIEKKSFVCQERRDIVVEAFIGHVFKLTLKRVQQRNKASTRVLWINLWEETERRLSLQKLFRS
jgi:hypothetical protein